MTPPLFIRLAAAALLATLAGLAPQTALAAPAPCVNATPAVVNLDDPAGDAEAGAPELTGVRASVNADCTVTVRLSVANRAQLRSDDALLVYLDTDGNPNTGARSFGGADQGVGLVADEDGPGSLALLGAWDPAADAIDFDKPRELDITTGGYGFTAGVDELGLRDGMTLGLSVAALAEPQGGIALDFAPDEEGGVIALPIGFATTATRSVTAPETAIGAPESRAAVVRRTCRVPNLKGRTLAGARRALKAAGCRTGRTRARYGTGTRKGRAFTTLPAGGSVIAATRPVTVVVAR